MSLTKNNKLPVYIISGFLGSGKTTVLLRILKELKPQGKQAGVVLNELGEVNVEKGLFEGERLVEMLNGCICCTIQSDLTDELSKFLHSEESMDVLIIEGTGIANPTEILEVLTQPNLIDKVEIESIITLVDTSRFLEYQSIFSSSKEIRKILKEQLTSCSLLLLNKTDLLDEKELNKVRMKIKNKIRGNVELIETNFGEVAMETLLKPRMNTVHMNLEETCSCKASESSDVEHSGHHDHNHGFNTVKIDRFPIINRVKLEKWLQNLPENVIRAKGIVQFIESPRKYQFQYASNQLQVDKINNQDNEPCIIIIGYNIDIEKTKRTFTNEVGGQV